MKVNKLSVFDIRLVCLSLVLMIILPGHVAAADLGYLFSTPAERKHLDKLRNTGIKPSFVQPVMTESVAHIPPLDTKPIKFNGFVKRSNGYADAWINGQHVGSDQALKRQLGSGNKIRIKVPDSRRSVRMKAGQVLDPATGHVHDVYEGEKPQGNKQ